MASALRVATIERAEPGRANRRVVAREDYPTRQEPSLRWVAILAMGDVAEIPFRGQISPDGTETVVFTDIERSPSLRERLSRGRRLRPIREGNRLVRNRVEAHDGAVVRSQRNGFMLVFSSLTAALARAVELQEFFGVHRVRGVGRGRSGLGVFYTTHLAS